MSRTPVVVDWWWWRRAGYSANRYGCLRVYGQGRIQAFLNKVLLVYWYFLEYLSKDFNLMEFMEYLLSDQVNTISQLFNFYEFLVISMPFRVESGPVIVMYSTLVVR